MHFDDRLATVMRLSANGPAIARIQFRQLIDLLGQSAQPTPASPMTQAAFARLAELGTLIPATERAALLREPMMRLTNPQLVAFLAEAEPDVASAAVAATDLTEDEWLALIPALPVRARGILRHRRGFGPRVEALLERLGIGDRGLPPAASASPERPRPEFVVLEGGMAAARRKRVREEPSTAGIGAIVRKIQAFRTARTDPAVAADPAQPPSNSVAAAPRTAVIAVDFTTNSEGRIDWAEGALASGLVGVMLAAHHDALRTTMRQRQPLQGITLMLPGAPVLAGNWRLDALPRFSQPDGHFIGYAGRLRRAAPSAPAAPDEVHSAADTMREVLHELRTPANAIQVAAEIIQQQLYGPAPHEYRALAAAIAGDTAQILAGFEELDRLVRLESGTLVPQVGDSDLGSIVLETVARLRAWTTPRGSAFSLPDLLPDLRVALDHDEAARLVWRLLAVLAGASASGDVIALTFHSRNDRMELSIEVSQALADRLDGAIRSGQPFEMVRSLSAGIFGVRFTLRLAAAEAAAAGGTLDQSGARFRLVLPGLTPAAAGHTQA
jgi:hypothetical protein